jgi:hypothetical protein
MASHSYSLAVVAAVNDRKVLSNNLAASPMIAESRWPLVIEAGYESASLAYNAGLDRVDTDVVVFAHQDVYLPRGWDRKLLLAVQSLDSEDRNWAVLGVVGVDGANNLVGKAWSTGLGIEIANEFSSLTPVRSVDELVIVLRKDTGLRFDVNLPGFHLYGTDIVQSALAAGFEAFVFDGPVVHNSLPAIRLDKSYIEAYKYLRHKWWTALPIYTTTSQVTKSKLPLLCMRLSNTEKLIFGQVPRRTQFSRHEAPKRIARDLGYEYQKTGVR